MALASWDFQTGAAGLRNKGKACNLLVSAEIFQGLPPNSVFKIDNILMQYSANKISAKIHDEHNTKNLNKEN